MNAIHQARNAIAALWGSIAPRPGLSTADLRKRLETGRIRKILLIRPHQYMGDLLLATPVFRALKESYPACELHFIGNPYNLAAVKHNPRLSKLWIWDKHAMKNSVRLAAFVQDLRRERFDLALVLVSNAPSLTSFLIARLSKAPVTGSCATDAFYGGTNWSRHLSQWQAPAARPEDPEYLKFFALVAPLLDQPCPEPEFHYPPELDSWARQQWTKLGLTPLQPPIALFLGGNSKRLDRLWFPEAWAKLIRQLQEKNMPVVAICPPRGLLGGGGTPEKNFYSEVRKALGRDIPVFDEPGLPQAAAFLKPVRQFICPDGGLFHVASAAGVKTLGLFFSSDPALWRSPLPTVSTLRAPEGRPDRLAPEVVLDALLN